MRPLGLTPVGAAERPLVPEGCWRPLVLVAACARPEVPEGICRPLTRLLSAMPSPCCVCRSRNLRLGTALNEPEGG